MSDNGKMISPSDSRYAEILQFVHQEAELLDHGRFTDWLELLTDDIHYRMPVRVNRGRSGQPDYDDKTEIFSENLASLRMRVKRLGTEFAWAESPPSRTRHLITNLRVHSTADPLELDVMSYFLVYRNRSNSSDADILSGERQDRMRKVENQWRLAARTILLDQVVVGSRNLSIFF